MKARWLGASLTLRDLAEAIHRIKLGTLPAAASDCSVLLIE